MVQSLKKHLNEQQAIFKQKVDDIQVILTSPTAEDASDEGNEIIIRDVLLMKIEFFTFFLSSFYRKCSRRSQIRRFCGTHEEIRC